MTLFDEFIAENVKLEAELWQIVKDHDLLYKQGRITDCMMLDFAMKFKSANPRIICDIVPLMDKLYVACLRRLALIGREHRKTVDILIIKNTQLSEENSRLKSDT